MATQVEALSQGYNAARTFHFMESSLEKNIPPVKLDNIIDLVMAAVGAIFLGRLGGAALPNLAETRK